MQIIIKILSYIKKSFLIFFDPDNIHNIIISTSTLVIMFVTIFAYFYTVKPSFELKKIEEEKIDSKEK